MKDNRSYYDDFAGWYERERHAGYHALIDQLQLEIALPLAEGRDALEVGCGTGLILKELDRVASRAVGIDLSPGMLQQAAARDLEVLVASATALPFADASFDFACSFKVLAHIEAIELALSEIGRVLRPGGVAALEFYNRRSLRALLKRLKRPHAVSDETHDEEVYTRYVSPREVEGLLPPTLRLKEFRGIRVFTPFAQLHKLPLVGSALGSAERWARDFPPTAHFGGFLVAIVERVPSP